MMLLIDLTNELEWMAKTSYSTGDILRDTNIPDGYIATCTTAGISGETEPEWQVGTLTDGTITWNVAVDPNYYKKATKASAQAAAESAAQSAKSAQAAETAATSAGSHALSASESEKNSKSYADNASASVSSASTSADNAKVSETNAKASETAAADSARFAQSSEANAKTSETNAAKSAEEAAASAKKAAEHDPSELIAKAHHYIQRNTAYKVGDVLTSPNLPYGTIIVVTQAGITGADEPDWTTIKNNIGEVIDDGTVTFKTVALYEAAEYHDSSTLTITNGSIAEPTSTYWLKRGKWVYVNISGIVTNDGITPVYVSGLPKPAYRVNAPMFSNRSNRCIGLFSLEDGQFASLTTGEIEQLYTSFAYTTNS